MPAPTQTAAAAPRMQKRMISSWVTAIFVVVSAAIGRWTGRLVEGQRWWLSGEEPGSVCAANGYPQEGTIESRRGGKQEKDKVGHGWKTGLGSAVPDEMDASRTDADEGLSVSPSSR